MPGALPDLALIDGGAAQLLAAARACLEAGVEVTNARAPHAADKKGASEGEDAPLGTLSSVKPPRAEEKNSSAHRAEREKSPFSHAVALASLAKGRASGEESVFVPRAVVDDSGDVVDFTADRMVVGPGAAATRGGKARAAGGPGARLLRAVRDESHAVALGAQRQRRRASLFREMRSARDDEQSEQTEQSVATG